VTVVGDVGLDVLCRLTRPLAPGDDTPAEISSEPGGAGANTAARLGRLGVPVELIARVGNDDAGRTARSELAALGVRCRWVVDPVRPTCRVVVLVTPDGERTMVSDRGANAALDPGDVALTDPERPGHLHLSGYVLLDPGSRPAGLAALERARRAGWTTSVDPQSAAGLTAVGAAAYLHWIRGVDLLLPNDAELDALGGPASVMTAVGAIAVTHGRDGASWFSREDAHRAPVSRTVQCDSTGAGDAFNAGFLAAWLAGAAPREALAAGTAAGTDAAATRGARGTR
jgi:sugar/nucleoside kinase (ribokinase family)